VLQCVFNPLESRGNYSTTSNNTKLLHWPLIGGLLHLVRRGETGWGRSPPRPILAVPDVTSHPSTASVPITVLLYDGPLLCGFNATIQGLTFTRYRYLMHAYRHQFRKLSTRWSIRLWPSVAISHHITYCTSSRTDAVALAANLSVKAHQVEAFYANQCAM